MTGRISDERFTELSADYEAEQRELKERAAAIQAELSKAQEATVNAEKFMNVVRRHTSFEELTPTLLREFVEKIVVHECSYDENKTRRQDIEIYVDGIATMQIQNLNTLVEDVYKRQVCAIIKPFSSFIWASCFITKPYSPTSSFTSKESMSQFRCV